ncbi:MAG: endonuclease/exonuclease/phosphatase family protein [Nocardioides sp.]
MRARLLALLATVLMATCLTSLSTGAARAEGFLDLRLSNVDAGHLKVSWTASSTYRYTVAVSASRVDGAPTQEYDEGSAPAGTPLSITVPHAPGATPESGAYTYVRIIARRPGSTTRTRWEWLLPTPVTPPSGGDRVKVATFNVRTWGADSSQRARTSWTKRRGRVVKQMVNSGAGVFLLQEASGSPKLRVAGKRWQYQDLARRLPDRFALARRSTYTSKGRTAGAQGNRIIYDASRYAKRGAGYFRLPTKSMSNNRWVPWVLLRSRTTGVEFYAMSVHFTSGGDKPGSTRFFQARQKQATTMVSNARNLAATGRTVYLGGDFNSTSNQLPYNNVHRIFVDAGFYDGFSTAEANRTNGAYPTTNGFRFPVSQQPYRRDYVMALHPTAAGNTDADAALAGSYAFKNYVYRSMSSVASDHFMQSATMPVKAGPY